MAPPPGSPPEVTAPPSKSTYAGATARGMLWMTGATLVARGSSFGSQLALGWILAANDFALYAVAIGLQSMARIVVDGGTSVILMQRGSEYDALARPMLDMAAMFNLVAAGGLLAIAGPAAAFYDAPELPPLLWIIAIAILLRTPINILFARLSIDMRFRTLSGIQTSASIVRHASMVLFALLGCGALSFVLPMLVVAGFEMIATALAVRTFPTAGRLTWPLFKEIFASARWILLGAFAVAFILQGDKLILGKLASKEMLAAYFFGWQLSSALAMPVSNSLKSVLMPTLSKLTGQRGRQTDAYLKALRLLTFLATPACVGVAVVAEPTVQFLWKGRWDNAIPAVQMLSMGLALFLCAPLARSLLEARGRWRLRALLLVADSAGVVCAASLGAVMATRQPDTAGAVFVMATWIMAYRATSATLRCMAAGWTLSIPPLRVAGTMLVPAGTFIACGLAVHFLARAAIPPASLPVLARLLILGAAYGAVVAFVGLVVMRSRRDEVLALLRSRRR